MKTSEQINELVAALSKAQGVMRAADKDAKNDHFRSQYATLASVWDAVRGPLSSNGLCVVQTMNSESDLLQSLTTRLYHSSGQWIESFSILNPTKNDPQGIGSATTYFKRYHLMALTGIAADDDDDGNAASLRPRQQPEQTPPPAAVTPKTTPKATTKPATASKDLCGDTERDHIVELAKVNGWEIPAVVDLMRATFGKDRVHQLTRPEHQELSVLISRGPKAAASDTFANTSLTPDLSGGDVQ